jgi:hypothetical protein
MQKIILTSLLIGSILSATWAQSPLFTDEEPLEFTLSADLSALFADRTLEDPPYHEGRISLNEASTVKDMAVKVKVGGNYRKNPNHCTYPPLRLKFKADDTRRSVFTGNKKLKLVTPCAGEEFVLKEYLVYKLFQELSDIAFQVRLVRVTLADQSREADPIVFTGFLIEDDDIVATRIGAEVKKIEIAAERYERDHITELAVFHYMIGNRDWDLVLGKNIKRLQRAEAFFALPYDYDFTGIVAPPYLLDHMGGDLKELKVFAPICRDRKELEEAIEAVVLKVPRWESIIKDFDLLAKAERNRMLRFIKQFSKQAQKPEAMIDEFAARCKN